MEKAYKWKGREKEYLQEYRSKNKDKIKANRSKYVEKAKLHDKERNKNPDRKIKMRIYKSKYRKNNIELCRGKVTEWRKKNLHKRVRYQRRYALKYPEKIKAQIIAKIIPIPYSQLCNKCNQRPAKHRHHNDYSKPLEVEFLCPLCHSQLHNLLEVN